jgi:ubiquitin-conjugating enzyme E2 D/E
MATMDHHEPRLFRSVAATVEDREYNRSRHRLRRIRQEFDNVQRQDSPDFSVELDNENLESWTATIRGPKNSPYEGGTFRFNVTFPGDFPYRGHVLKFITKIYHPNIESSSGTIAWGLTSPENWCPITTMEMVLLMMVNLLLEPEKHSECELVPEIEHELREKPEVYWQMAKAWTEKYAKGEDEELAYLKEGSRS